MLGQGYLPVSHKLPNIVGVGVNVQLGDKAAGFIACAVCQQWEEDAEKSGDRIWEPGAVPLQGEAEQSGSFKSKHEVGDPQDSPLPRQDNTCTLLKILECLIQGDSPINFNGAT